MRGQLAWSAVEEVESGPSPATASGWVWFGWPVDPERYDAGGEN